MRSCRRRNPTKVLVPLALFMGAAGGLLLSTGATAESIDRSYVAVAEANGMLVRYGIPGFIAVDNFIDGGGPSSQALLADSAATSFGSLPYPGSAGVGYPGLVNLAAGHTPPGYPFYVSASHPTQPDQSLSDPSGAYSLQAKAAEGSATGDARMVPAPSGTDAVPITQATSETTRAGDMITARGLSVADGLVLGPLSIGRVRSQSVTTYRNGSEQPTTATELAIEGGRAGEVVFSFGREGFQFAQSGIPLPAGQGLATLNQVLAPAGMSVRFDEAVPLQGGAIAAAFEITSAADVPGAGKGTFTIRMGGASSYITLAGVGAGPAFGEVAPIPAFDPAGPAPENVSPQPPVAGPTPASDPVPTGGDQTGPGGGQQLPGPSGYGGGSGLVPVSGDAGLVSLSSPVAGLAPAAGPAVLLQEARLAVGQRHVGALSLLGAVLMVGAAVGLLLVAVGTRRTESWTA
jgi:hypothetical protein